jgi:hypothetical protein
VAAPFAVPIVPPGPLCRLLEHCPHTTEGNSNAVFQDIVADPRASDTGTVTGALVLHHPAASMVIVAQSSVVARGGGASRPALTQRPLTTLTGFWRGESLHDHAPSAPPSPAGSAVVAMWSGTVTPAMIIVPRCSSPWFPLSVSGHIITVISTECASLSTPPAGSVVTAGWA